MIPYLLIILAFAADRVTKGWAADNLSFTRPIEVNDFLTFQKTYNRGVAFGMFQGIGPIVGWFSILIVVGLFVYMLRTPRRYWILRAGLALIIGGALGNLIDRVTAGQVLDFIQVSFLPGIFNISDVMVNVGMFVSLAAVFLQPEEREVEADESQEESYSTADLPTPAQEPADDNWDAMAEPEFADQEPVLPDPESDSR